MADGEHRVPLVQIIAGDHLQMGIGVDRGVQTQPQQLVVQIHCHRRRASQTEDHDFPGVHQQLRRRCQGFRLQHVPGELQGKHGALEHLVPHRLDGILGADLLVDDLVRRNRRLRQRQLQVLIAAEAQLLVSPNNRGVRNAAGIRQRRHRQVDDPPGISPDILRHFPLGFAEVWKGIFDSQQQRRQRGILYRHARYRPSHYSMKTV